MTPTSGSRSPWGAALLVVCAGLGGGLILAGDVAGDQQMLRAVHRVVGSRLDGPMAVVSGVTDLWSLALIAGVVVAALLLLRDWATAGWFLLAVGTVWVVNPLLKQVFARGRPDLWSGGTDDPGYAFPAGHAANTTALLAAALLLLWHTAWRRPALVVAVPVLLLTCFAQLALGRHYPSDLLAGCLWALAWVLLARRWLPNRG